MLKKIVSILLFTSVFGCNSNLTPKQQAYANSLSTCEKVEGLLASFNQGFEPLRATRINNKYSDSWAAKYHVVGNNCQIIIMGDGNTSYKCAKFYKEEAPSKSDYNAAVKTIRECLPKSWKSAQSSQNQTLKRVFSNGTNNTKMTVRNSPTLAKFGNTWETTFEVGGILEQKKAKN